MQQLIVILIVAACALWLGVLVYRYMRPKPGTKGCAGGCCAGVEKKPAADTPGTPAPPRTQMISSDNLRLRLKVRKG